MLKNPPAMQETWVQSLGWEHPLERAWQPTPVFLPGEFHGQKTLAGYNPWGHKESDMTERLSTAQHSTCKKKKNSILACRSLNGIIVKFWGILKDVYIECILLLLFTFNMKINVEDLDRPKMYTVKFIRKRKMFSD